MISVTHLRIFISFVVLLTAGCKKDDDSSPEIEAIIDLDQTLTGQWVPDAPTPLPIAADNYPFVGSVIGVSKRSQLNGTFSPDQSVQMRVDSLWAATHRPYLTRSNELQVRVRTGETIYLTMATPLFNQGDSNNWYFKGQAQCKAHLVINQGGGYYQIASQAFGVYFDGGWSMIGAGRVAVPYTDPQGRKWILAENTFVVP